jgi:hypothetical protein
LIGSGVIKLPALLVDATPTPDESVPESTAAPAVPLGGGLILAYDAKADAETGFDVFTIDAGTGERTLLGTLPPLAADFYTYNLAWGADRKHVLITGSSGAGPVGLEGLTDAGRELTFVCCEPPGEVRPNTEKGDGTFITLRAGIGWVLSPQNDRIVGLHESQGNLPGCAFCSVVTAIAVADVDGGNLRTLPLPDGAHANSWLSWSPDGSAVVVAGCRPCNNAGEIASSSGDVGAGGDWAKLTPTAVEHAHLFVVPVDGSPVQELFDEAETSFWSAAWSPDGTAIAFGRYECAADEHAPYCLDRTHQLVTMNVANGEATVVAQVTGDRLVWSPDGRRITFADETGAFVAEADGSRLTRLGDGWGPTGWSPDGAWLLFSRYDQTLGSSSGPWIVQAEGGEPSLLGPFDGWVW